jgi:hypothetical protein
MSKSGLEEDEDECGQGVREKGGAHLGLEEEEEDGVMGKKKAVPKWKERISTDGEEESEAGEGVVVESAAVPAGDSAHDGNKVNRAGPRTKRVTDANKAALANARGGDGKAHAAGEVPDVDDDMSEAQVRTVALLGIEPLRSNFRGRYALKPQTFVGRSRSCMAGAPDDTVICCRQ